LVALAAAHPLFFDEASTNRELGILTWDFLQLGFAPAYRLFALDGWMDLGLRHISYLLMHYWTLFSFLFINAPSWLGVLLYGIHLGSAYALRRLDSMKMIYDGFPHTGSISYLPCHVLSF
jgi:hypothetical protein